MSIRKIEELLVKRLCKNFSPQTSIEPNFEARLLLALALHRLANAMEDIEDEDEEPKKPRVKGL